VEVTLDAVVDERDKTRCDDDTELVVRRVQGMDVSSTYSATSVSASKTLLSLIHMEQGGTHPPAAPSARI